MGGRLWAIILAGGEGSRLRDLARDERGEPATKQFCRFGSGRSLLVATLARAERLVPRERIVVSVLEAHRQWWARALADRPSHATISQPCSRGTAAGVLAPLLRIQREDREARVVIIPSDHAVEDEAVLQESLERAVRVAELRPEDVVLLGFTPETPDPTLGWILPVRGRDGPSHAVLSFVEKPDPGRAERLMASGAMWNGMLIVAMAGALIRLYQRFLPELFRAATDFHQPRAPVCARRPVVAYATLPTRDLSRDLLTPAVGHLRLVPVPPCGWTDLGTPDRLLRWQTSRGALSHAAATVAEYVEELGQR